MHQSGQQSGSVQTITTQCVIAGSGPGGLMLGLLLARAGVNVTVLEKHPDFLRDFRGDTVHPSTLDIIDKLGLLGELLKVPHTQAPKLHAEIGGQNVTIADFSRLPVKCRFIAFMPQWDFLDFLAGEANKLPNFRLVMSAAVTDLIENNGRIEGLVAETPEGCLQVNASLVVGADGRNSVVRAKAGLESTSFGAPSDVLWIKLLHKPEDPPYAMGHGGPRQGFVMVDRGEYWQCGYVVRKGSFAQVKEKGLDAFRQAVAEVSPLSPDRVEEITSWDDVHLLSIRIDRLNRWWRSGLLCIGDAAHAMSPIGGFGVNLAIQDAVAAANILAVPLRKGKLTDQHLMQIEKRRAFPTKAIQKIQLMMQSSSRKRQNSEIKRSGPPAFVKGIARWPILAHLAGRLVGMGVRREKLRSSLFKTP